MTTNQDQQCSRDVTYDFGRKVARCGSTVNGGPVQCDDCRRAAECHPASDGSTAGPDETVRNVCREALSELQEALNMALSAQEKAQNQAAHWEASANSTRARIADLQAFLSAA